MKSKKKRNMMICFLSFVLVLQMFILYPSGTFANKVSNENSVKVQSDTSDSNPSNAKQSQSMTAIPRRGVEGKQDDWTLITVRGIKVEQDGKLTIGLYTQANPGNVINLDQIQLQREKNQDRPYELLKGGDISMLTYLKDHDTKFYDENGTEEDELQILSDTGLNITRIRLYNDPGKGHGDGIYYCPQGYSDLNDILKQAKESKEKGMKKELSFHYSDYWSNAATQNIPAKWQEKIKGKSKEEAVTILENCIYTYTKDTMESLKAQGTLPEYVSLGNEMQNGILYPLGKASNDCWPNLARFLNAGARAVKEVSPNCRIILHLDEAGNEWKYTNFFDNCQKYNVSYDIIGASYYPFWTGKEVSEIVDFCNDLVDRYDKDIVLMETGFNFNDTIQNGKVGQLNNNGPYPFGNNASSPANQREFMYEVLNGIKSVKDGRCIGDFYWDLIMVEQKGVGWAIKEENDESDLNYISNTALFDFSHKLLPAADAYRYNTQGGVTGSIRGKLVGIDKEALKNSVAKLVFENKEYQVTTDQYGQFHLDMEKGTYSIQNVVVQGMQYVPSDHHKIKIKAGELSDLTLTVEGGSVTGIVQEVDGSKLPNMKVEAAGENRTFITQTKEDGSYEFTNLPVGEYDISVKSAGYEFEKPIHVQVNQGNNTLAKEMIVTQISGAISGMILDETRQPLSDVKVVGKFKDQTITTSTDENGIYVLSGLIESNSYTISFEKTDYVTQEITSTVSAKEIKNMDTLILQKNEGSVHGRVLDSFGQPILDATVKLSDDVITQTTEDGTFSFSTIPAGKIMISVSKDGYMSRTVESKVIYKEDTDASDIVLPQKINLNNPSFEFGQDTGWTLQGDPSGCVLYQQRDAASQYDKVSALVFWSDHKFQGEAFQKISGLQAGEYVFRIHSYTGMTHSEFMNSTFQMYVKDASGTIIAQKDIPNSTSYMPVELPFTLDQPQDCTIGFFADGISEDWAVLDMAELGMLKK